MVAVAQLRDRLDNQFKQGGRQYVQVEMMADMGHKFEERDIDCPFCKEGKIPIKEHRPDKRASLQDTAIYETTVEVDECPECGKSKTELRKKMKGMGYPIK